MAAAGVKLALQIFPSIRELNVLFIGAGEMIELVATHFAAQQPAGITVANRTLERGERLAQEFGGRAIVLQDLASQLAQHDVVVTSTASPVPVLGKGAVEKALKARRHKPMFMLDLAVPRDIEAEVGELADVFCTRWTTSPPLLTPAAKNAAPPPRPPKASFRKNPRVQPMAGRPRHRAGDPRAASRNRTRAPPRAGSRRQTPAQGRSAGRRAGVSLPPAHQQAAAPPLQS